MAEANPKERAGTVLAAVKAGDLKQLKELIKAGAAIDEASEQSPLAQAVEMGRADLLKELLKAGADVNFGGLWVPVCVAARNQSQDVMKVLIAAGAKVDAGEEAGATALMYAAATGNLPMVKLLLKAGADPEKEDEDGESAIIYGRDHPKVVEYLEPRSSGEALEYLAKLNEKQEALTEEFLAAAKAGDVPRVKQMLAEGMPVGKAGAKKETALHAALRAKNDEMLEFLLAAGAPVDARNDHDRTPLYEVAGSGNLARAERLIQAGADVNIHDKMSGDTPFLHSVSKMKSSQDMMRLLARHGADVKARDNHGQSALGLASRWLGEKGEFSSPTHDEDAANLRQALIDSGALHPEGNRFTAAAAAGDMTAVRRFIDAGVPVDTMDEQERTALHMAISREHPQLVEYLLKAGARLDLPIGEDTQADRRWGGLAKPCPKCGHIFTAIVPDRKCRRCQHPFNTKTTFGWDIKGLPMFLAWSLRLVPLMTAVRLGDPHLVKMLLEAGADPNLGRETFTPLMAACNAEHVEAARLLIAHGADPKHEGRTIDRLRIKISAISIAAAVRNVELLNLLWDAGVPAADKHATLLVAAAFNNDAGAIQQLAAKGAGPDVTDPLTEELPLDTAAAWGSAMAVAALIAAGATVDPPGAKGHTPLMRAMTAVRDHARENRFTPELAKNYVETVKTLLVAGARATVNYYDVNPLSLAQSAKCEPLIELLTVAMAKEKA